jgi:hypothetical protein
VQTCGDGASSKLPGAAGGPTSPALVVFERSAPLILAPSPSAPIGPASRPHSARGFSLQRPAVGASRRPLVFRAVFVDLESFSLKFLLGALAPGSSPGQRWWPGGHLVFHTVFVHLESFALKLVLIGLVAGQLLWLPVLIWSAVIAHFELLWPSYLCPSNLVLQRIGGAA